MALTRKVYKEVKQNSFARNYICGYDRYDNPKTGKTESAICIMKKDIVVYCTTRKWKISIMLFLMKLVGIQIIQE